MDKIKKIVRNRLISSIVFSILFITGIVFIVLGLSKSIKLLLIIGLISTFIQFYLLPLLWFNFVAWKYYLKIYKIIIQEDQISTFDIANMLSKKDKDITKAVKILIENDLLQDYQFKDLSKLVKIKK